MNYLKIPGARPLRGEVGLKGSEILLKGVFGERDELGMRKDYESIPLKVTKQTLFFPSFFFLLKTSFFTSKKCPFFLATSANANDILLFDHQR